MNIRNAAVAVLAQDLQLQYISMSNEHSWYKIIGTRWAIQFEAVGFAIYCNERYPYIDHDMHLHDLRWFEYADPSCFDGAVTYARLP